MLKHLFLFIATFVFFTSCSSKKNELSLAYKLSEIHRRHEGAIGVINDTVLTSLEKARGFIGSIDNPPDSLLIENTFQKGDYYERIKNIDSAIHYFQKTIDLIDSTNTRKRDLTYFRNAWELYFEQNQDINSKNLVDKYLTLLDKDEDYTELVYAYNQLTRIYTSESLNIPLAFEYHNKSLEMSKLAGNKEMTTINLSYLARLLFTHKNDTAQSFHILDSLKLHSNDNIAFINRQVFLQDGVLRFYTGDYQTAIQSYQRSLWYLKKDSIFSNLHYTYLADCYGNIAEAYRMLDKPITAQVYLDSAWRYSPQPAISQKTFLMKEQIRLNYSKRRSIEQVLADFDSLSEYQNIVFETKMNEELAALELANTREKKLLVQKQAVEIKNTNLKKNETVFISLTIILLLITLLGIVLFRQRRLRFERQNIQMQQRLLRSQMNPHFTFNSLSAIKKQIKQNPETGVIHLSKFSRHLRIVMENSMFNNVLFGKEIEALRKYMDLQLYRFPQSFTYQIEFTYLTETDFLFIPPMLLQPIVENCIKHGFLDINRKGEIKIHISKKHKKYLHCTIEDNGIGLNGEMRRKGSIGLISDFLEKTTNSKIEFINKSDSDTSETGVAVNLLIPYTLSGND